MVSHSQKQAEQILQDYAANHISVVQESIEETFQSQKETSYSRILEEQETFNHKVNWISNQMTTVVEKYRTDRDKLQEIQLRHNKLVEELNQEILFREKVYKEASELTAKTLSDLTDTQRTAAVKIDSLVEEYVEKVLSKTHPRSKDQSIKELAKVLDGNVPEDLQNAVIIVQTQKLAKEIKNLQLLVFDLAQRTKLQTLTATLTELNDEYELLETEILHPENELDNSLALEEETKKKKREAEKLRFKSYYDPEYDDYDEE